jgi:hypothetical protein
MKERELRAIGDVGEFLTDKMIDLAKSDSLDREREKAAFDRTFSLLSETANSESFHRYDQSKDRFMGGFLLSAYEVIALGVGYNQASAGVENSAFETIIKRLWRNEQFNKYSGSGVRASSRIPKLIPLGRRLFKP